MRLPWTQERVCPPMTAQEPMVSALSPARLLARSLTDPETRGEWVKNLPHAAVLTVYSATCDKYRNEARGLTVARYWGYGGACIYTPFTLSEAEDRIVGDALTSFDRHLREEREKEALARLIAPAQGIEAATAGETRSGSTVGESPVAEGDAPNSDRTTP